MVGTLGRGGPGMFALDITNPASPTFLWEERHEHPGARPQIGRPSLPVANGDWRVILGNGVEQRQRFTPQRQSHHRNRDHTSDSANTGGRTACPGTRARYQRRWICRHGLRRRSEGQPVEFTGSPAPPSEQPTARAIRRTWPRRYRSAAGRPRSFDRHGLDILRHRQEFRVRATRPHAVQSWYGIKDNGTAGVGPRTLEARRRPPV
jgi:hypothetical protein